MLEPAEVRATAIDVDIPVKVLLLTRAILAVIENLGPIDPKSNYAEAWLQRLRRAAREGIGYSALIERIKACARLRKRHLERLTKGDFIKEQAAVHFQFELQGIAGDVRRVSRQFEERGFAKAVQSQPALIVHRHVFEEMLRQSVEPLRRRLHLRT